MFGKELKRVCKSLVFLIIAVVFMIAISGQLDEDSYKIQKPVKNQEEYGNLMTTDLHYIFPNLIADLYISTENNSFTTYPYGFFREKNLSQEELSLLRKIISNLLDTPYENINLQKQIHIPDKEKLEIQLTKIDALLGGGSFFAKDKYILHYGNKGQNYEEALADYDLMIKSGIDTVFARYFSDYAGIFSLLFPWLLVLFIWHKDRPSGITDTISVKCFSSVRLITVRILAISLALFFIILLLYSYYEIKMIQFVGLDILNPIKAYLIIFLWSFPNILLTVSLSSFLFLLTNHIFIGFLGPILSLIYVAAASSNLFYQINGQLLLRYNSIGNEQYFLERWNTFLTGRLIWIIVSVLIILLTALVYDRKRRGYYVFKNKAYQQK